MFPLKVLWICISILNISCSMYYLTNFHTDYPDARVIVANCGDTVSLACRTDSDDSSIQSTSSIPVMWFRLYQNAYPQPLILGDRQLIDDQRFMLRTQGNDRHLEIVGARKDDQGYYICKVGNTIHSSYNLTIRTSTCIDILPNSSHISVNDGIRLLCRIRSTDTADDHTRRVQWTRNDAPLNTIAESRSNYSSTDGTLYETLVIRRARKIDTGIYQCQYGPLLTATAHVVVHPYPGGSKSRRLITQITGNSSSSNASLRTVISAFYIVYQLVFVTLS